eukprot:TRINITY_DN81272_c0_g1_i1.p1 TRINITY_DN81272_c0_g1~~TRINITY_DN81272_c0_g1_i1.p1  ORF type:complete len:230 (+),score=37.04 TRINITY_DN81272_c0_g1_i1:83-772(+)
MAGSAAAAIGGVKRGTAEGRRIASARSRAQAAEAARIRQKEADVCKKIMDHFDVDKSGILDTAEVTKMLGAYSNDVHGKEHRPSEQDVEFLTKLCDRGSKDNAINRDEVLSICHAWSEFVVQKSVLTELAKAHDHDNNGVDEAELGPLLHEVAGFIIPAPVVNWIFVSADLSGNGSLEFMELARALCAFERWRADATPGCPEKCTTLSKGIEPPPEDLPPPKSRACNLL